LVDCHCQERSLRCVVIIAAIPLGLVKTVGNALSMPLTNKVAVIVGATGTLGPAIAKAFASDCAKLALIRSQKENLDTLQRDLGFRDTRVIAIQADAANASAMQQAANTVLTRFGRADILLCLTGGFRGGSLMETSDDVWDYVFDSNVRTAVNAIRAFQP